jgi:hypothetical protein
MNMHNYCNNKPWKKFNFIFNSIHIYLGDCFVILKKL